MSNAISATGTLFIVSAPSGAGKTTLVNGVLARIGKEYTIARIITYTSRPQRPNEQAGVDYHFITETEFQDNINQGFFLEWSTVYGTYYGTPRHILDGLHSGCSYIVIIDRAGARRLKEVMQGYLLYYIWIQVPSLYDLGVRLNLRGDCPKQIAKRLALAQEEIENEEKIPMYDYYLMNDFFEKSVKNLEIFIKTHINLKKKKEIKKAL